MGPEEGILYADCNLDLGIQMKLRHDFAGHYNRPDIFQMHINRAAPQLYRVHNDPAALAARRRPDELPSPPPRLDATGRRMNAHFSKKQQRSWTSLKRSTPASPAARFSTSRSIRKIVKDLIARAARAASGGNLQSWNVYALTGTPLAEFKAIVQKRIAERRPAPRQGRIPDLSRTRCSAPTRSAARSMACSSTARSASTATTPAARLAQYKKNFEFFDAPVALFITIDRRLGPGQWADLGGYIHALAFLARGYGLDTCPQEAWARLYDTVGEFLKIRPNEMLFCGMAIGYGDRKHKANDFRSPRAEL